MITIVTRNRREGGRSGIPKADIVTRVTAVISEVLALDESRIKLESRLIEDLGATSLDLVQLLWTLEEEFGATIPDEDVNSFITLRDVIEYVASKYKSSAV